MTRRRTAQPATAEAATLPPGLDPLMTTAQVAVYIGGDTTARTLEGWRGSGDGPDYIAVTSRMVRYRLSAVDAWLDTLTRTGRDGKNSKVVGEAA